MSARIRRSFMAPPPDEIRAARRLHKLTQSAAAELAHVSSRTWEQWEQGRRKISEPAWTLFKSATSDKSATKRNTP